MRAVVYDSYGELPIVRDVQDPECAADGAVIAVRATGVCRSDWHAWRGHDPVTLPHVPGHEFAGTIIEIGCQVTDFRVGERVTMPFVEGCGRCEYCRSGNAQVCPKQTQPGFTGPGSFAERVAIHGADVNLVRLPASVDFRTAAALGCRFATAFRAVTTHGRLHSGQWIAVFGLGGVGLSAVMIAVNLGARVVAIDNHRPALDRAIRLGAEVTLSAGGDSSGVDVARSVREITGGGAHVAVEAVGSAHIAAMSVRSLRRRGRHVQVGLLLGDDAMTALPMDLVVSHELEIYGSHGMAAADYTAMLSVIESNGLLPERLIGSVISLDDAGAALAAMDNYGADGMTIIEIPEMNRDIMVPDARPQE